MALLFIDKYFNKTLNLPSSVNITDDEVQFVIDKLR